MYKKIPHEFILQINAQISFGKLKHKDGSTVELPLEEGMISEDGKNILPKNYISDKVTIPTNQLELKITPDMIKSWKDLW